MDFFVKLVPPRTTFAQDISAGEQEIMQRHAAFWTDLVHKGTAVLCGPVLDPAGIYGVGVIEAESEPALRALLEHDPGHGLLRYEMHPMRAVHRNQQRHSV